jgi:hypothetical protein
VKLAALSLALTLTGCAAHAYDATASSAAQAATQGAVSVLDDPATKGKLADLATSTVAAALGGDTEKRLRALTVSEGATVRAELTRTLTQELVRKLVRAAVDEALSPQTGDEADKAFARAFGAEFRAALIDAIGAAGPAVAADVRGSVDAALAQARADMQTQLDGARALVRDVSIGAGVLLVLQAALHEWRVRRMQRKGDT